MSTSTLGASHAILASGCQNANLILSSEFGDQIGQAVFIVSQAQFDEGTLSIPWDQQGYVADIQMIARPYAQRGNIEVTKAFFVSIILPMLNDLFKTHNASKKLQQAIMAGFQQTFGGFQQTFGGFLSDDMLPVVGGSSSCLPSLV